MLKTTNDPRTIAEIHNTITAITFDLWGTLLDDTPVALGDRLVRDLRMEFFQNMVRRAGRELSWQEARAAYRHGAAVFDQYWKRRQAFDAQIGIRAMLEFVGVQLDEADVQELVRYFEEVNDQVTIPAIEGVPAAVAAFAEKYRLGVISDTGWTPGRILRRHLQRNGLLQHFAVTVFSDEAGATKPHPRLFEAAATALKARPHTILHIGDLLFTDVRGAKAAGYFAAWIHRPDYLDNHTHDDQPDLIVSGVAELAEIILGEDKATESNHPLSGV